MNHRTLSRLAGALVSGALAATALAAAGPAPAHADSRDTTPLIEVLAADGNRFDANPQDFDIAERAVRVVLRAKPGSPLRALANGERRLTLFLPTDNAFKFLVGDLTPGPRPRGEKATFRAVASLGVDTVETVLLYHVVPGVPLNSPKVVAAAEARARVETAAGAHVRVRPGADGRIELVDLDRDDRNPLTVTRLLDLNRGNRQVAHGIDRVLRPANL